MTTEEKLERCVNFIKSISDYKNQNLTKAKYNILEIRSETDLYTHFVNRTIDGLDCLADEAWHILADIVE